MGQCAAPKTTSRQPVDVSTVIIVDDDEQVRTALADLFASVGFRVVSVGSATELLRAALPDTPSCLLLDIRLPGVSGLDIQSELAKRGNSLPIVFMTGHGDIPMTVQAMKAGAVDFLGKPFRHPDLLRAVNAALAQDRAQREIRKSVRILQDRYKSLTPREAEVMWHVTRGLLNKEIAFVIGVTEATIKVHRSNLTRKMGANSVAELVLMAQKLEIQEPPKPE